MHFPVGAGLAREGAIRNTKILILVRLTLYT
jgi:hypothetical protein